MMTTAAVIVDAVRSPMGRGQADGRARRAHPVDLLARCSRLRRAHRTRPRHGRRRAHRLRQPGRRAVGDAGPAGLARRRLPEHVPAVTIERKCGSGQQAVDFAAQGIMAGAYDIVVAGGVESMSRVPMGSARMGGDPFGPGCGSTVPGLVPQGVAAELVAAEWKPQPEPARRVLPPASHAAGGRDGVERRLRRRDRADSRARRIVRRHATTRRSGPAPRSSGWPSCGPPSATDEMRRASRRSSGRSPRATPRRSPTAPRRC